MIRTFRGAMLVAAVAGCTGSPGSSPSPATPTSPATAPASVTAIPTPTTDPRPAPVGRIAFLRTFEADADGNERRDAFVVDADGRNVVRLTDDARVETALYWLTDGSRFVIVWEEPHDPYHQFMASALPDGSDRRELGSVTTTYSPASTSPNGRYVAFGGDGGESGETGIRLLDLSTGSLIELTNDGAWNPIWSPDGDRLMVMLPGRRLGVLDSASGDEIAVIGSDVDSLLGWTVDGQSVLFYACTDGMSKPECMAAPELIADADGSEPEAYLDPLPTLVLGSASPDGDWVAEAADGCVHVIVAAASATRHPLDMWTDLVAACSSPYGAVSWSPDSAWLATSSGMGIGRSQLVLSSPFGGTPLPVTEGPSDGHPAWQPSTS